MKIKVSKASGVQLDWLVAKIEGLLEAPRWQFKYGVVSSVGADVLFRPSENWAQGGPIIEREKICSNICTWNNPQFLGQWNATCHNDGSVDEYGPTMLIAGLRCYVASRMGDDIEVPEELS